MKNLTRALLFSLSILLTGCFDIFEEVRLKEDGSGTYALKMDLSKILQDDFMKGMLQQSAAENEATKDLAENMEKDTTIYFKDLPEEAKKKTGRPEFWNNVQMRIKVSERSSEFYTDIRLSFKHTDDIAFFYKNLSTVMEESGGQTQGFNPGEFLPGGALFKFERKSLVRLDVPKPEVTEEATEDIDMMKMFLGSSSFTTTYYLPGAVTRVTIPDATVNLSQVTVKKSLVDMMDGKGQIAGEIRFK